MRASRTYPHRTVAQRYVDDSEGCLRSAPRPLARTETDSCSYKSGLRAKRVLSEASHGARQQLTSTFELKSCPYRCLLSALLFCEVLDGEARFAP
ncbi:hypothetical protein K466DRAFT_7472 [Polyporus arcularius HHB13444]|uniref:Uncharacterized protein n=1 Tax=Polyporus arcularius HHB13444 TaxID=1314778 RepID=A0A5C3NQ47_9APHY|nr:hypothetical protein K466DRAFT_7472 [Polyporus arcularius HHB13444]